MPQGNGDNAYRRQGGQSGRHGAPKKRGRNVAVIVVLVLVIAACAIGAALGLAHMQQTNQQIATAKNEEQVEPAIPEQLSDKAQELPDNPIDFDELKTQNEEIYAWIYVPGTNVNYPIVARPGDNAFYLDHDESGQESELGAIFTEDYNTRDFTDGVTLVYGHNIKDGLMFSTLHYFEDPDFFEENAQFYIYMPGHVYTYDIVSAFTTDDRHVLYRYGYFQTYDQLRAFEQEVLDPHSILQNTRAVELDDSSKLVVLSTCNSGALEETGRYLVCGVLVDDQPTK